MSQVPRGSRTEPVGLRQQSDKLKCRYFRRGSEISYHPLKAILTAIFCCLASLALAGAGGKAQSQTPVNLSFLPPDPLTATAFDHFYNLDYDHAIQEFTQILQRHPDDAFAINHLLSAILFHELYRMGVLNAGEYANDSFIRVQHNAPDPHAQDQIKDLTKRALAVEQNRLAANPNDVQALYARGVTRAQFATYTALIEHAWFSALRNAVGARRDHERILEIMPAQIEARLIVGTHNYVVGSLPWALRSAGAMAGLGGNKEKGLQLLHDCASGSGETSVDAKILLALFLRREHRYDEALPVVRQLIAAYPRNILMALEEGNLLRAQSQNDQAEIIYRKIWQAGKLGRYPGSHYEIAALSLADLLSAEKQFAAAAEAYEQTASIHQVQPAIAQKANLGAGEMYDALQKRDLALKKYQAVIAANADAAPAEAARKYLKEPYRPQ